MNAKKDLKSDWSSIPPELLNCIAKSIKEISDFIRYRAVCSTWRSSIQITDLPPQFPWISKMRMYPFEDDLIPFYSITLRKTYSIQTTKSLHKCIWGPSEGYMFTETIDHHKGQSNPCRSLLNPLINHEISLPPYTLRFWNKDFNGRWIGPRKNQMREYVAFECDHGLPVYQLGQNEWSKFYLVSHKQCSYFCLKGMIFCAQKSDGITKVIDINTSYNAYVIPPVEDHSPRGKVNIIEASGDILRVFTHSSRTYSANCQFDVHRLDVGENYSARWVKVNNIGDQAVFIDKCGGFVIKASEIAGIKANCMYILKRIQSRPIYGVIRIDIANRTKEVFRCPFKDPDCWFMPNLIQFHIP